MKLIVFLYLIFLPHNVIAEIADVKFPLYNIGIKIKMPQDYSLLSPENLKEVKSDFNNQINICNLNKIDIDKAINNPNYEIIFNNNKHAENISFAKLPKFDNDHDLTYLKNLLTSKYKESCQLIKNAKIESIKTSTGKTSIGSYFSILNKITTPELIYYSDLYVFEARNATIIFSINNSKYSENFDFVNNLEYVHSEQYEIILNVFYNLSKKNELELAKSRLIDAINLEPKNVLAFELLALLNFRLKNYNDVIETTNDILEIDPININAELLKGKALAKQLKYEEAIHSYEKAILNYSTLALFNKCNKYFYSFAEMYKFIGDVQIELKNSSSAIENLKLALKLSNDSLLSATIYYNLGKVNSTLMGNSSSAIDYYSSAIPFYPSTALSQKSEALYNRALNKRYLNDLVGAIVDYSDAINIRPNYIHAYYNRGYAKMLLKDYLSAIDDFTAVIKFDNYSSPSTISAFGSRGIAKLNLGMDGCSDLKVVIDSGKKDYLTHYNQYCK